MKKLIFTILMFILAGSAEAQLRLDENFDYPAGDSIGAYGWNYISGGSTNRILVTSPGLTYAEYPLSGIGNATTLTSFGQDQYKTLSSSDSTGSVYAFSMVRVDTAKTGDYFFALLQTNSTTNYEGRVNIRSAGAGSFNFGITKANASTDTTVAGIWTTSGYSIGTTYLVVLKYEFVPGGATNDKISLFVFSSGLPGIEPAPTIGPITYSSNDAISIGRVALRQGTFARAPHLAIDGIHISKSWFPTIVNIKLAIQGITMAQRQNNYYTSYDTVSLYLRNSASPYNIADSAFYYGEFADTTGIMQASFEFPNLISGDYWLDIDYRRSPIYRNGLETWSGNTQSIVKFGELNYDFTDSASKAYGNNQYLNRHSDPQIWCLYNGDVNGDYIMDATDGQSIDNAASAYTEGYDKNDTNNDGYVDGFDMMVVDNNAMEFVAAVLP